MVFAVFAAQSAVALVAHRPLPLRVRRVAGVAGVARRQIMRASMESLDGLHMLGSHAQCQWEWSDAVSMALADVAAAIPEDKGWFGTGLLKGVDPFGTWQAFIQGSIVQTHDLLFSMGFTENTYGLAIMAFTYFLRVVTLPLTFLQSSAAEQMKALQPIVEEIKVKYPNADQQNVMVAQLYEDTKSNPLAGCLPSLVSIPIFIALYRSVLNLANENILNEPFLFLPSLEGPTLTEKLMLPQGRGLQWISEGWTGGVDTGDLTPLLGWEATLAYLAIPVIITLNQAVTQQLTMPAVEPGTPVPRTQALLKYIPLLIGFFSLQVPSALCVYWFTSNLFTSVATASIKKYFADNPPKIGESGASFTRFSV